MHPKEARKEKTGTGRLCNLVLRNSRLLIGVDFTDDDEVNALIADPDYNSVVLFPAAGAVNLSQDGYQSLGGGDGRLQVFVVDGTWSLAGKIFRQSTNLQALPAVSFTPSKASTFRIKKQPRTECLSTLESIHLLLELAQEQEVETTQGDIEQLPRVFRRLVDIQLEGANLR